MAIAADEKRLLLHCGLFEPLPCLELLLLIVLSKLLVKCLLEYLVLLLDHLLPYSINILRDDCQNTSLLPWSLLRCHHAFFY